MQFGIGDLEVPNPTESALVRAGGLQTATWLLRTDLAMAIDPQFTDPHAYLSNPDLFNPLTPAVVKAIGVAAQKQVADFFVSGGATIPNPNNYFTGRFSGLNLFQIPTTLPDGLNFLQIQP